MASAQPLNQSGGLKESSPVPYTPTFVDQFYKTKICPFFLRNECLRGDKCSFAHTQSDLRTSSDLSRTRMCKDWQKNQCNRTKCSFAHSIAELRHTDDYYKTALCAYWSQNLSCPMKEYCRHAHGHNELRGRGYRWTEKQKSKMKKMKNSQASKTKGVESLNIDSPSSNLSNQSYSSVSTVLSSLQSNIKNETDISTEHTHKIDNFDSSSKDFSKNYLPSQSINNDATVHKDGQFLNIPNTPIYSPYATPSYVTNLQTENGSPHSRDESNLIFPDTNLFTPSFYKNHLLDTNFPSDPSNSYPQFDHSNFSNEITSTLLKQKRYEILLQNLISSLDQDSLNNNSIKHTHLNSTQQDIHSGQQARTTNNPNYSQLPPTKNITLPYQSNIDLLDSLIPDSTFNNTNLLNKQPCKHDDDLAYLHDLFKSTSSSYSVSPISMQHSLSHEMLKNHLFDQENDDITRGTLSSSSNSHYDESYNTSNFVSYQNENISVHSSPGQYFMDLSHNSTSSPKDITLPYLQDLIQSSWKLSPPSITNSW